MAKSRTYYVAVGCGVLAIVLFAIVVILMVNGKDPALAWFGTASSTSVAAEAARREAQRRRDEARRRLEEEQAALTQEDPTALQDEARRAADAAREEVARASDEELEREGEALFGPPKES